MSRAGNFVLLAAGSTNWQEVRSQLLPGLVDFEGVAFRIKVLRRIQEPGLVLGLLAGLGAKGNARGLGLGAESTRQPRRR